MWKTRPMWPASAARAAGWPRLAEARGSLRHDLVLKGASGEPAGRGLIPLVSHIGERLRLLKEAIAAAKAKDAPAAEDGKDIQLDTGIFPRSTGLTPGPAFGSA